MKRCSKNIEPVLRLAGSSGGFSLLELLIATAIFLVIISSAMGLYITHQRHAFVQEEVTDMQQSLRLGTESILQDIRMAGLAIAVPSGPNPIYPIKEVENNLGLNGSDIIRLNSISSYRILAMITIAPETYVNFIANAPVTFTVSSATEAASFTSEDLVRVLNPMDREDVLGAFFTVQSVNTAVPSITLLPSDSKASRFIPNGAVIAKTGEAAPDIFPNVVEYCIGPDILSGCGTAITSCPASDCLIRMINGAATEVDIAATNVTGLQLSYLVDGNPVEVDTVGALQNVRAVRVTLSGENTNTKVYSNVSKTRGLTTIVKLRNR